MTDLNDWLDQAERRGIAETRQRMSNRTPREPKAKGHPELDAQRAVVEWLRKAGCITSMNYNEAQARERDPIKRARFWMALRRSGVTPGFPDVTAILPDGRTVYIEMKAPKGAVSDEQEKLHAKLRATGAIVVVARCIWTAQSALYEAGVVIPAAGRLKRAAPVGPLAR